MTLQIWTALVVIATSLLWLGGQPAYADNAGGSLGSHPSHADVDAAAKRFNSGLRMIDKGDYADAIGEIEEAYQLDPKSVHLYNLGVAHQSNGNRDKAIDYYRRYLAADPGGTLVPDAQRYLYKLEAEASAEKAEQARAEAAASRAEAAAARAEATASRTEATAARAEAAAAETELKKARERADKAELALRNGLWTTPPANSAASKVEQGIVDDANSGHSWLMPTALTEPAGTGSISDLELAGISASYAVTDRLAVGATIVLPNLGYDLTAKFQLLKAGRLRIAAHGMLSYFQNRGTDAGGMATVGEAGGVATLCIDTICRSHLSGYLAAGVGGNHGTSGLLLGASSLALGIGKNVKAVFEIDKGASVGGDFMNGAIGWVGLRLTTKTLSLDGGIATPLDATGNRWLDGDLPFFSVTYRGFGE